MKRKALTKISARSGIAFFNKLLNYQNHQLVMARIASINPFAEGDLKVKT